MKGAGHASASHGYGEGQTVHSLAQIMRPNSRTPPTRSARSPRVGGGDGGGDNHVEGEQEQPEWTEEMGEACEATVDGLRALYSAYATTGAPPPLPAPCTS